MSKRADEVRVGDVSDRGTRIVTRVRETRSGDVMITFRITETNFLGLETYDPSDIAPFTTPPRAAAERRVRDYLERHEHFSSLDALDDTLSTIPDGHGGHVNLRVSDLRTILGEAEA